MTETLTLGVNIGGSLSPSLENAFASAEQHLDSLSNCLGKAKGQVGFLDTGIAKAEKAIGFFHKGLQTGKDAVNVDIQKSKETFAVFGTGLDKAKNTWTTFKDGLQSDRSLLEVVSQGVSSLQGTFGIFSSGVQKAQETIGVFRDSLKTGKDAFNFFKEGITKTKDSIGIFKDGLTKGKETFSMFKENLNSVKETNLFKSGMSMAKRAVDSMRLSNLMNIASLGMQKAMVIGSSIAQKAATVATWAMTAAQWAFNVAMSANPIGLIILGVVALGTLAVGLYKKWEPFRTFIDGLWTSMKSAFSSLLEVGSALGSLVTDTLMPAWEPFMQFIDSLWETIKDLFEFAPIGLIMKAAGAFISSDDDEKASPKQKASLGSAYSRSDSPVVGNAVAAAQKGAAMPHVASASQRHNTSINAPITINAARGMDEQAIAEQVGHELNRRQARAKANQRGALYD